MMIVAVYLAELFVLITFLNVGNGLRQYNKQDIIKLREEARDMFYHAYNGYIKYAGNYDELRPLSCDGVQTWSSSSLTLIDALDTNLILGNYTEFRRVYDILKTKEDLFDKDINVSVFETNIRIVGGLISAHLLSHKAQVAGVKLEAGYPCNGPLLRLAQDVAKRLLPAFDTKTGMPYGTVNLKHGVPSEETSVTCTAGIGTFIIEFGALSRLTGDPIYEEVSLNALYALFNHRSSIGLVGNHIDVQSGVWTAQDAGIGAGVDSYYEYLVKGSIMLNRPELMHMFNEGRAAIDKYLKRDDWHIWASMNKGQMTLPVFQSLQAFWPGLLSLLGDINTAMKTLHNYHSVWKQYGFLPEFYNIPNAEAGANRDSYPLRPELIESVMYLYRATGDPYLLEVGEDILKSIQYSAKTPCGYATIKNVRDHKKQDSMESFFLAETTKYLYLLFDSDNFLNSDGSVGTVIETPNGECIMETGIFGYIFNTEAHPIDLGALKCCHDMPRESLVKGFNRQKFLGDTVEVNMEKNTPEVFETILKTEITYESDDDDPVKSTNDFKKVLVNEIMSALTNAKKKIEENIDLQKRFTEITNREKDGYFNIEKNVVELGSKVKENIKDDSLVLADLPKTEESDEFEDDTEKVPIEIIKLPLEALDSDAISSKPTVVEEDAPIVRKIEIEDTIVKGPSIDNKTIEKDYNRIINNHSESNNSFLADFAQILHFTNIPRKKFDSQKLLEKIRVHGYQKNESLTTKYELLTCKAQPYLQRISVMGEFY